MILDYDERMLLPGLMRWWKHEVAETLLPPVVSPLKALNLSEAQRCNLRIGLEQGARRPCDEIDVDQMSGRSRSFSQTEEVSPGRLTAHQEIRRRQNPAR
ncbi:hypothetical protein Sj15T_10430 [Sphingobium sp. TA15]|nr:hypothetical protein Sj15T_10430 [Sphingobium sp. TA15]